MITKTIGRIVNGKYVGQASTKEDAARLKDMLDSQQAPDANTEREFFKGRHNLRDSFDGTDHQFGELIRRAKKAGYTPQSSDVYEPSLATGLGDPLAFIPSASGKSHVRKVAEKRNWSVEGAVKHKSYTEDKDHFNEVVVPLNKFGKK